MHLKYFFVAMLCLAVSACGLHPRGEAVLPPSMQRVTVQSCDAVGPLKRNVEAALQRSGAKVETLPGEGIAEIKISNLSLAPVVRSVNANARVNEFTMLYHVELEISDNAGKVVLPKQVIEQSRVFTFDATQAIGTGAEQDEIKKEMERDMAQSVMRRIDAVTRKISG